MERLASWYAKSMRNHTFCKIDVKFVTKQCKTKKTVVGVSTYISYVLTVDAVTNFSLPLAKL